MNGSEQRTHRTVTAALARSVEEIADRTADRLNALDAAIGLERSHRLTLAHEQRRYVDNEVRQLRACCQERWDSSSETSKRTFDQISAFRDRTFWGRLRWLVRGD